MEDKLISPLESLIIHKSEVQGLLFAALKTKRELLLTYFNQNCFNVWFENIAYRNILGEKFSYYLDGFGMWATVKIIDNAKIRKFNASEVNEEIFGEFIRRQIPVILIGANFPKSIRDRKPLDVEKYFNGYEDLQNYDEMINRINDCSSKIVIIGLGVPLQEELAYKISQRIPGLQILCVGNFLEFYYGTIKRAPRIFHNSGFEWAFRLITEPKRLWRRYILGIPVFIIRLIKMKITKEI
ncbi:MAG: hypothetical protein CVV24_04775 [Ignavibacteriae bacterium HGW-Ignavibacteriae-3]|nr:MAG: hypothetical protein CVV24_04775 [Ignavibacteriae bacterium HGW-Ignavibacteriae-3]